MTTDKNFVEYAPEKQYSDTKSEHRDYHEEDLIVPAQPPPYSDLEEQVLDPSQDTDVPLQATARLRQCGTCCKKRRSPCKTLVKFLIGFLATLVLLRVTTGFRWKGCSSQHHRHHQQGHNSDPHPSNNRSYTRHEHLGSITGTYDLYDHLELSTITGSIDITIRPHPGPKPAVLKLHSATGSITTRISDEFRSALAISPHNLPFPQLAEMKRKWNTEITTNTGTVTVSHLIGGGGTFYARSNTGVLNLDLLAVHTGRGDPLTRLSTLTRPGPQNVRVRSPSEQTISMLQASHVAEGFGAVDVTYPAEWAGRVDAQIKGTGNVVVVGEGLVVDVEERWRVKGHRGQGGKGAGVSIVGRGSGSLKFSC